MAEVWIPLVFSRTGRRVGRAVERSVMLSRVQIPQAFAEFVWLVKKTWRMEQQKVGADARERLGQNLRCSVWNVPRAAALHRRLEPHAREAHDRPSRKPTTRCLHIGHIPVPTGHPLRLGPPEDEATHARFTVQNQIGDGRTANVNGSEEAHGSASPAPAPTPVPRDRQARS